MKNLVTEERLNSTMERWKKKNFEAIDNFTLGLSTREMILAEEEGEPQGIKFRGRPVHFDKTDNYWKFTEATNNYAFS